MCGSSFSSSISPSTAAQTEEPAPRLLRKVNFNLSALNVLNIRGKLCSLPKKRWACTDVWSTAGRLRGASTSARMHDAPLAAKSSRREHKRWCTLDDPRLVVRLNLQKGDYTKLQLDEVKRLDEIGTQCRAKARKSGHTQPLAPPKF